ncbi:uncharacterized protein LOC114532102 [Dendronephthya gigantea]|uniref:uncharacterized protein LOC114532102 n=1 Tax=Dendronephthya gigantea TaxID=151771 RepID=UPI00106A657F|nr:uncharacterized protein LOC114532102 [Dendronephthya gigantea]
MTAPAIPPAPMTPPQTAPRPPKKARLEQPEKRKPLCAQVAKANTGAKRVQMMQKLAAAGEKDEPPNHVELELFWGAMNDWKILDAGLVAALQSTWEEMNSEKSRTPVQKILTLTAIPNGVSNCIQHCIGNLVREFVRQTKSDGRKVNYTAGCDAMEDEIRAEHYRRYLAMVKDCACESCESVIEFDEAYTRYHDNLEMTTAQMETEPVRFADRPMHCDDVDFRAQSLRTQFTGLSSTSLLKALYFSNSTPAFSPPTLSLAMPTDVQSMTTRYLQPFLRERKLQDPLPQSWKTVSPTPAEHELVSVPKKCLRMFDGDSGEILLTSECERELHDLATDDGKLRFRLRNCDAPETECSVRIYKQPDDGSTTMTPFLTRHIGIEALRAARELVFRASEVLLHVGTGAAGQRDVPHDRFGRRLVQVFTRNENGSLDNLTEKLAAAGYTLSFYTTGIDVAVDAAMRAAIVDKEGIFSLPEEVFTYPNLPWDIRKMWGQHGVNAYEEYRPILNRPEDPTVWACSGAGSRQVLADDGESWPESQDSDNFFFRIVSCSTFSESRCFVAKSEIPNSGHGLFLARHKFPIESGAHICLYAERSTTEEEMNKNSSSRSYAIFVHRKKRWFDAEVETANNLGRFANQPWVLEAFKHIRTLSSAERPPLTEEDWAKTESRIDEQCNARFDTTGEQLVLRTKRRLEPSKRPTEILVNYGGLRSYWIPLLRQRRDDEVLPESLREIVAWLFESPECNWSTEQRTKWAFM